MALKIFLGNNNALWMHDNLLNSSKELRQHKQCRPVTICIGNKVMCHIT